MQNPGYKRFHATDNSVSMIVQRLKWGMKWLLGTSRGGRNFGIFPDDIFLVSFPKSGNTWMRFLIANLLAVKERVTFSNIECRIPDVYKNTRNQLARIPRPRILKTHEYFDPRYRQVIYIVRDPRDVVISYYHFHRKTRFIPDDYPIDQYVSRFVNGQLDEYGTWYENVSSWLATRYGKEGFLLLRYEDLSEHPEEELAKVVRFLRLDRTRGEIRQAIELSSAGHMRALEKKEADIWINTKTTRKDIPFIRTAAVGKWRSELSRSLAAQVEASWRPLMESLGYLTVDITQPNLPSMTQVDSREMREAG